MGTYTANKNLYMPTVGEQGWGDLMNTNLSTIDNFLKPITVSGSTYTFTGNHVGNQSGGSISATSISNSGTLTQTGTSTFTGKITANGGIGTKALSATSITNSGTLTQAGTSTFTGKITANGGVNDYEARITALENVVDTDDGNFKGRLYTTAEYVIGTDGDLLVASIPAQNLSIGGNSTSSTITVSNYTTPFNPRFPFKIGTGVWIESANDISGTNYSQTTTGTRVATVTFTHNPTGNATGEGWFYVNGSCVKSYWSKTADHVETFTYNIPVNATTYIQSNRYMNSVKLDIEPTYMYLDST